MIDAARLWRNPVSWFVIQSLLIIVLAFLLGLLVGWLWWGRQWRKVRFSESDAITTVTRRHQAALKEKLGEKDSALASKDAEITRLGSLVPDGASESADLHQAALADKDAEIARLTGLLSEADTTQGTHHAALADKDALLSGKDAAIADRDAMLSERESLLNDKNAVLADKDTALHTRDAEIARLSALIGEAETAVTSHREELAARQAALADKDVEIARLNAAAASAASAAPTTGALPLIGTAAAETPGAAETAEVPVPAASAQNAASSETAEVPVPAAAGPAATAEETSVIDVTDAETVTHDDLERVEGIGPRIGAALRGAGIHSFRQLADAETATLQGALEQAGLRFAPSLPTWSRQARLLADGDEAGFVALTESLVAGRDVSGTA
jgi:predicted flap endonuclease-1-like 5' DNA nuclease